ncbi:MAG TPA: hypothetical protein VMW24_27265 [Sedimentisphaerales bacterium]|nr:hypothetical protein [Sedimentisphaerales bacterium]
MTNLPKFNQLAYTYEQFLVPDDPFIWPKVFQCPDHRIVLLSNIQATITIAAPGTACQLAISIGAGPLYPYQHWFHPTFALPSITQTNIHPGPSDGFTPGTDIDADFTIPDHLYLFALDILTLWLGDPTNPNDITNLTVTGRSWIL